MKSKLRDPVERELEELVFGDPTAAIPEPIKEDSDEEEENENKVNVTRYDPAWSDSDDEQKWANYSMTSLPKWSRYVVPTEESIWASEQIVESGEIPSDSLKFNRSKMSLPFKVRPANYIQYHPSGSFFMCLAKKSLFLLNRDAKGNGTILSEVNEDKRINSAGFSGDGAKVVLISQAAFKIYNIEKQTTVESVSRKQADLSRLAISSKERDIFATISGDNTVVLYSQKTNQSINQLTSNVKLNDVTFSSDSNFLYASGRGEVYVWDLRSSEIYARYTDYGNINTPIITNCPNGIYQATGSDMGVVNLYKIEDNFKTTTKPQPLLIMIHNSYVSLQLKRQTLLG
jgi:WD40 repeat protein